MVRGYDKHQERLAAVGLLGKDLARRAGRRCEWCEGQDDLRPWDAAPNDEPELDTLALFCARCRDVASGGKADPRELRFLEGAVWHECTAVSETARKTLRGLDTAWARDTLELVGG